MIRKKSRRVCLFGMLCLLTSSASAETLNVPARFPTIQEAIEAAANGDVVVIAEGTYTGVGNRDIRFLGKAITVRSTDPADWDVVRNTIIDCESAGRGFVFQAAEGPTSVLDGVTITNGFVDDTGGGIRCDASSPIIRRCFIAQNSAYGGGGIFLTGSDALVSNCIIAGNVSRVTLGGGVVTGGGSPTIRSCLIVGNDATMGTISGAGGGVASLDSDTTISGCAIVANRAGTGGGVAVAYSVFDGDITITDSLLWGNTADDGAQLYFGYAGSFFKADASTVTYSNVSGGLAGVFLEVPSSFLLHWGPGNIDEDPEFIDSDGLDNDPATWQDNDYHLGENSPCIDHGDPAVAPSPSDHDIDGDPRVLDGDADAIARIDIGSDEFGSCEDVIGDRDCNGNGVGDTCDIVGGDSSDCNVNGVPDDCEPDCNQNGTADDCDIADATSADCYVNAIPDSCDIAGGSSVDCNSNGVPDECEPDCNENGVADECDIASETSEDCAGEGVPDECEPDCNQNDTADSCDILSGVSADDNASGVPDECETPTLFVDLEATGNGSGTSWADAFTDLQGALSTAAASAGLVEQIWVAAACYEPSERSDPTDPRSATFHLVDGVAVFGGFAGGETSLEQRDIVNNETILSGDLLGDDGPDFENIEDNAYHVLTGNGSPLQLYERPACH